MDQPIARPADFETDHKSDPGHLLSDAGFTINTADHSKFVDGKAFLESDNKGQYFEKTDLEELGKEISQYLQQVAQDTSRANNGAEINVLTGLGAAYLPHHQFMDTGLIVSAKAGSGVLEGNPVLPDQKTLDAGLQNIVQKFEKDLKGNWNEDWPALSIIGDFGIRDSNQSGPLIAESKVVDNQRKPKAG